MDHADREKLAGQLAAVDERLWEVIQHSNTWQASIGPVRLERALNSMSWFRMILAVSGAAFVAGVALTFIEQTQELGVALVVGAIFAGVSFLGQVWTVQTQKETAMTDRLYSDEDTAELRQLLAERTRLAKDLDAAG